MLKHLPQTSTYKIGYSATKTFLQTKSSLNHLDDNDLGMFLLWMEEVE